MLDPLHQLEDEVDDDMDSYVENVSSSKRNLRIVLDLDDEED